MLRNLIVMLALGSTPAFAESSYWHGYPLAPTGQPYGHHVVIDPYGRWQSDAPVYGYQPVRRNANRLTPENTNRRNGQLAYRAAYQSFIDGPRQGFKNKIEPLVGRGRWVKKITTYREIVMYKDSAGNVALQSPDGKWHITDGRGDYAQTHINLPANLTEKEEMVAKVEPKAAPKTVAKAKKKGGRSLASISKPVPAAEPKKEAAPGDRLDEPLDPVFDNPLLPSGK